MCRGAPSVWYREGLSCRLVEIVPIFHVIPEWGIFFKKSKILYSIKKKYAGGETHSFRPSFSQAIDVRKKVSPKYHGRPGGCFPCHSCQVNWISWGCLLL